MGVKRRSAKVLLAQPELVGKDGRQVGLFRIAKCRQYLGLVTEPDRRRVRNSGPYLENPLVLVPEPIDIRWHFGARANDAHVPPKNVDQLGELVDLRLAENPADPGDPRIFSERDRAAAPRRILDHGAKL